MATAEGATAAATADAGGAAGASAPAEASAPADPGTPPPVRQTGAPPKLPRWLFLALPVIVIGIVIAAFALKRDTDRAVERVNDNTGFATYTDKVGGFSIKHPRSWKQAAPPRDNVRLLVSNGVLDSLLVRVERTAKPLPPDLTAEEAKAIADTLIKRPELPPERILREQALAVNGAPAYYYLYTFDEDVKTDKGTGKVQGVHAHYFVFSGRRAFSLVFQALPSANFQKLARTFDTMAESFTVMPLPSDAPDPAPSTTAPPTTAAPQAPPG